MKIFLNSQFSKKDMRTRGSKVRINSNGNLQCTRTGKPVTKKICINCEDAFGIFPNHITCKRGMGKGFVSTAEVKKRMGR